MAITIPILTDFNGSGINKGIKQFNRLETKGQKAGFLIRKAAIPAALALGAIGLAAKAGVEGVMADDEALANLESTLTATGNAANITSASFFAYANELQKVTGTGADQITQGAALLATFKNVRNEVGKGNDVFNRATEAALDLSQKGFGDLSSTNKMLGKALNDPIQGITALSRAGVTFTDEQKETIKTLQATGRTLDAQKIILKEVESQVGGTAEAFGQTTRGKLERSKRAFEEMQKTLARALLPALEAAASIFQKLSGWIEKNSKIAKILIGTVAGLAAAVLVVNGAMKVAAATMAVVRAAQIALNLAMIANPIGLVVAALAALVGGLIIAYNSSESFRGVIETVFDWLKKLWEFLSPIASTAFDGLKLAFEALTTPMQLAWEVFKAVYDNAKPVIDFLAPLARSTFDGIKTAFNALDGPINAVKSALKFLNDNFGVVGLIEKITAGAFRAAVLAFQALTAPVRALAAALRTAKTLWEWFKRQIAGEGGNPFAPGGSLAGPVGTGPRPITGSADRSMALGAAPANVGAASAGGVTFVINMNAGLVSTPDQIGQQIIEAVQRAQRRSGPAFVSA